MNLNKINLSPEQARFAEMVSEYPRLAGLWDWQRRELKMILWENEKKLMSHSEIILAQFFISIWTQQYTFEFDLIKAASLLDKKARQLIASWILEPFWP
ncbi:hypothetical protein [Xenorhabdus entomophaga]|uniref:hypothetical protein n=1 Tax=Xenorhabdus entomophaga TaxID=3136257 RepID=UPI0030F3F436